MVLIGYGATVFDIINYFFPIREQHYKNIRPSMAIAFYLVVVHQVIEIRDMITLHII